MVHPHAGGCIEFADEIDRLAADIPHHTAGLCLDTGHLYCRRLDPAAWLSKHFERLDYLHFKDVDPRVFREVLGAASIFTACAEGVMPVGRRAIDYPQLRALLAERGYRGWITIEQERDPCNVQGSLRDVTASLRCFARPRLTIRETR